MKNLATVVLAAFLTYSATAEVVVYQQKISVTQTGGGTVKKISMTGFSVIETGTAVGFIAVDQSRKRFEVITGNPSIIGVTTSGKADVTGFAIGFKNGVGGIVASGRNTPLEIRVNLTVNTPKVFKVSGGGVQQENNEFFIFEYKGAMAYAAADTGDFNARLLTVGQSISELRLRLLGQGLTEE